jgi:hypothetical protein
MAAPRALANRLGKHQRGIDRTTAAALANPAQALLLSPLSKVRVLGSGDHPLVADVSTEALLVCGRCGAPAFLWPIPEEGDGRRFRLGPPRSGATRQAPGLPLRSSPLGAPDHAGPLGRSMPPTPLTWKKSGQGHLSMGTPLYRDIQV